MAFLQDAAQDLPELLKKMENFASGIGYKIIETDTTDLQKDPCTIHFDIDPIENQTDRITSETVPDRILKMHLLLAPKQEGGAIPIQINDLVGPFPNVWFFSTQDQNSIWVVVQTADERYTHFGFGVIDKKGMTTPDCAFAVGLYYQFWGNYSFAPANNEVYSSKHKYYFRGNEKTANLFIPDGVLDSKYFPE